MQCKFVFAAIGLATLLHASPTPISSIQQSRGTLALGELGFNPLDLRSTNSTESVYKLLQQSKTRPSSVEDALNKLRRIGPPVAGFDPTSYVREGFTVDNLIAQLPTSTTSGPDPNSSNNINLREPQIPIFPKKAAIDAPYTLTQAQLREVIHIPVNFTFGAKPPVLLVPGTGSTGYLTFAGNFIKLLANVEYADPVWLNIPGFLLGDAQTHAEYVAYAVNYVSSISSGKNVSVIAWSQGNLDTQWALKFWPSVRAITSNLISISPDFDGTVLANLVCTVAPLLVCNPAVKQQHYFSSFIKALHAHGGDSAYVPTTTIYSATDEIVQPQSGVNASAIMNDVRGVGVTNAEVQRVCRGRAANGYLYLHESVLFLPIAFALVKDALGNGGPGQIIRVDVVGECARPTAPGLGLADVLATEANIPVAAVALLLYPNKTIIEPPLRPFALLPPSA